MKAPQPEDILLPVEVGGLRLRNPFIVGSGPCTKSVDQLVAAERCGWGGASSKLAMEPLPYVNLPPRYRWLAKHGCHVFTAETRLSVDEGLRLIEAGRRRTRELILFANLAYCGEDGPDGWARMAKRFEAAGAHAIEINLCCPNMSFNVAKSTSKNDGLPASGASIGTDPIATGEITKVVKQSVGVPVFVKISPEAGNIELVAEAAFREGADGVTSVGNHLGMPPFDIADPSGGFYRAQRGMSLGCLSGPIVAPLAQREVFEIRKRVGPVGCIVGLGGARGAEDAIRFAMCGADLVGICTETMLRGFDFIGREIRNIREFLRERGLTCWRELRDGLHPHMRPANELYIAPAHAVVDEAACTGCGVCLQPAHCSAIHMGENKKAHVDAERCLACSTCIDLCKANALRMVETAERKTKDPAEGAL